MLAPEIQKDLGISSVGDAAVLNSFLSVYAIMYLLSGRIVLGTRRAGLRDHLVVDGAAASRVRDRSNEQAGVRGFACTSTLALGLPGRKASSASTVRPATSIPKYRSALVTLAAIRASRRL